MRDLYSEILREVLLEGYNLSSIKDIFKQKSELSQIGTPDQYAKYLDTIFPSSKLKDILYHGIKGGSLEGDNLRVSKGGSWGEGIYLTPDKELAKSFLYSMGGDIVSAIADIKSPKIVPNEDEYYKLVDEYGVESSINRYLYMNNYDSAIRNEYRGSKEVFVLEPEQLHILGTQKDIEGFKNFVSKG